MSGPLIRNPTDSANPTARVWEFGPHHASSHISGLAVPPRPAEQASPLTPEVILLAEDNDDLREVMRIFLDVMGYAVIACADALVAADVFHSGRHVDLLLTDIEMPGKSGVELARELRTLRPHLPVLIVSAALISSDLTREMRSSNWLFLSKPYSFPDLLVTVRALLASTHQLAA